MGQLTSDVSREYKVDNGDTRVQQDVDAATTIYAGSAVGLDGTTNYSRQLVGGDEFLGFADNQAANVVNPAYPGLISNNGIVLGAAGGLACDVRAVGVLVVAAASLANAGTGTNGLANLGQPVFMSDGNTLTLVEQTQTITLSAPTAGGSFSLVLAAGGQALSTGAIAYNATGTTIAAALAALGNGSVVASGTGTAGAWTLTYGYGQSNQSVQLYQGTTSGAFTGGLIIQPLAPATNVSQIGKIRSYTLGNFEIAFKSAALG